VKRAAALAMLVFTFLASSSRASAADDARERADLIAELRTSPHRILYEAYAKDNWELFLMNADGSGKQNLTNTKDVHELYPQASPSGKRICFLVDVGEGRKTVRSIYYMDAGGGDRTLVAHQARQPCWSSDGRRIAFVKMEYGRFNVKDFASKGLFIYDLETKQTTEVANKKVMHLYNLNWSLDQKWIVSTVHGGMGYGHAILAIEVGGQRVFDLKLSGCRPCLSADSRQITWSSDDHTIRAANIDFSGPRPIVSNPRVVDQRKKEHLYHPDFSPGDKYITYSIGPGGRMPVNGPGTHSNVAEMIGVRGHWDLHLRRASGRGPIVNLTKDA
jgi:Tol biopolymer transport system component